MSRILEEKQRIISEILHIPEEDFDTIADIASNTTEAREAREILLAALSQAKSLTHFVNSSLRVGEEDVVARGSPAREPPPSSGSLLGPAGDQLIQITSSMNQHLTDLLAVMSERDEERELLRRQLAKSQDQIRGFFRFLFPFLLLFLILFPFPGLTPHGHSLLKCQGRVQTRSSLWRARVRTRSPPLALSPSSPSQSPRARPRRSGSWPLDPTSASTT